MSLRDFLAEADFKRILHVDTAPGRTTGGQIGGQGDDTKRGRPAEPTWIVPPQFTTGDPTTLEPDGKKI